MLMASIMQQGRARGDMLACVLTRSAELDWSQQIIGELCLFDCPLAYLVQQTLKEAYTHQGDGATIICVASQGFYSRWGQLAHLTRLQSFIRKRNRQKSNMYKQNHHQETIENLSLCLKYINMQQMRVSWHVTG
jgi:hypothetical protein